MTAADARGLVQGAETPDVDTADSENLEVVTRPPKVEVESRPWRKPQWRPRHVRMGC